ncbi:Rieske domain-containing protein [Pycnococcus provasolii]
MSLAMKTTGSCQHRHVRVSSPSSRVLPSSSRPTSSVCSSSLSRRPQGVGSQTSLPSSSVRRVFLSSRFLQLQTLVKCSAEAAPSQETAEAAAASPASATPPGGDFIPVLSDADLPKGERKITAAGEKSVLLFWYKNKIVGIEPRSPAEAAYSEGFIDGLLTQNDEVTCPQTASTFSLKDGSITSWYPSNPVLRALTPQELCRPLEVFPVQMAGGAIYVDPVNTNLRGTEYEQAGGYSSKGGFGTSAENNNIYGIEPRMYIEGTDPDDGSVEEIRNASSEAKKFSPATLLIQALAAGIIGVAGTAVGVYYESPVGIAAFWLVGFLIFGSTTFKFFFDDDEQ